MNRSTQNKDGDLANDSIALHPAVKRRIEEYLVEVEYNMCCIRTLLEKAVERKKKKDLCKKTLLTP